MDSRPQGLARFTRNESHFRNELHAGQPLRSQSVAEWTLPEAPKRALGRVFLRPMSSSVTM